MFGSKSNKLVHADEGMTSKLTISFAARLATVFLYEGIFYFSLFDNVMPYHRIFRSPKYLQIEYFKRSPSLIRFQNT